MLFVTSSLSIKNSAIPTLNPTLCKKMYPLGILNFLLLAASLPRDLALSNKSDASFFGISTPPGFLHGGRWSCTTGLRECESRISPPSHRRVALAYRRSASTLAPRKGKGRPMLQDRQVLLGDPHPLHPASGRGLLLHAPRRAFGAMVLPGPVVRAVYDHTTKRPVPRPIVPTSTLDLTAYRDVLRTTTPCWQDKSHHDPRVSLFATDLMIDVAWF